MRFPKNPLKDTLRRSRAKQKLNENRGKAFLVHGRDHAAADWLRDCLEDLDILVIQWEDALILTGSGSPYTLDIVKSGMSESDVAVILFTPDEEVKLREELHGDKSDYDCGMQSRPNVWIEAGMAIALSREHVILVELDGCRPASDLYGLHFLRYSKNVDRYQFLVQLENRLKSCGCRTNKRI